MATAQVTLKLTPHELQIVHDSLTLYRDKMRNVLRETRGSPLVETKLPVYDGRPEMCANSASEILKDIGMM